MAEYGLNLWDYWRIIHKRKWIIISIFLISLFSAHFFGKKTVSIYKSSITLNVDMQRPIAEITGSGVTFWGASGPGQLSTQLELIKSYNVLYDAAKKMGMITDNTPKAKAQAAVASLRGKIAVERKSGTMLVDIIATDQNAERAKEIAETVAEEFIQKNWERKVEEARNTKNFVEKQLQKLEKQSARIKQKLDALGVEPARSGEDMPEAVSLRTRLMRLKLEVSNLRERYTDNYPGIINRLAEIENIEKQLAKHKTYEDKDEQMYAVETMDADKLRNELTINRKLYAMLKERYEKALILEASKAKGIEVVNPAMVPKMPATVPAATNVVFGGVIGLILGLVAALITESMDTSIGTIEDVEEYLRLPVLGVIPHIEIKKEAKLDFWKTPPASAEERSKYTDIMSRLVTQYRPKSPISEAYRNLQTYIKFSGLDKYGNCLMFTSAGVQEGKTITSVNSALSMAQMGYKVLIVDCDLRRPSVHKVFGIDRETGLTEAVLGTFKLDDVVKTMDDIMMGNIKSSMILKTYGMENLNIITAGHLPSNPSEILGSQNMSNFIKEAKEKFQVVLFDSAPILPVTDSCILSSKVDGVILVYEVGRVSRGALRRSKMQLESAKGRPIGVVLNSMRASDMRFGSPFYYHYQKYYGDGTPKSMR
ncbi:MAG: AAA family ATPase [Candidatus Omnitrophica bacterium]|nr:AAA family ATPase [Candidatus Omnitrophota bacterium]